MGGREVAPVILVHLFGVNEGGVTVAHCGRRGVGLTTTTILAAVTCKPCKDKPHRPRVIRPAPLAPADPPPAPKPGRRRKPLFKAVR